jgi:GntR family transcriptional regulator
MLPEKRYAQNKFLLDARPLHLRLEEAMDALLKEHCPGDRLPSEEQLSEIMGVSRATIREMLRALEERGRIIRRHGVGTFIAPNNPLFESGLEILESVDALAKRMGVVCEVKDLSLREEPADAIMAEKLKLNLGAPVCVVTRTRVIQDAVIAYMYDIIPAAIVSADQLRAGFTGSVLEYFQTYKPIPKYAVTSLLSIQANKDLAQPMQVVPGTALLLLEECLYAADDQLLNFSHNYYNTKYFRYHILRRSV